MDQDWSAVGKAITERLDERGMTMTDLAAKSGVSLTTVRELVHVLDTRRRQPRTLVALSETLGWPGDHLAKVLHGRAAPAADQSDLDVLKVEMVELRNRVTELENHVQQLGR